MDARQTRSQTGAQSSSHVVGPKDDVPDKYHLPSASKWGKSELDRLCVDFELNPKDRIEDLSQLMGWTEEKWSNELRDRLLPYFFTRSNIRSTRRNQRNRKRRYYHY